MSTTSQSPIFASAHRLAMMFHHGWAYQLQHELKDGIVHPNDIQRIITEMNADSSPMGPGIYPSNTHTTGTGRLSWVAEEGYITITIDRPASIVGAIGSLTVLRARVFTDEYGCGDSRMSLEQSGLAEDRHWAALFECLWALNITPQSPSLERATKNEGYYGSRPTVERYQRWIESQPGLAPLNTIDPLYEDLWDLLAKAEAGRSHDLRSYDKTFEFGELVFALTEDKILAALQSTGDTWTMRPGRPTEVDGLIPTEFVRKADDRGELVLVIEWQGSPEDTLNPAY